MSELKSCPCCGEEIQGGVRLTGYMMMNRKYIKCDACGLKMESSYDIDGLSQTHLKAITEDFIRRWNTRKPMERIVERLEEYRDDFMNDVYEELREDADNCRANRIIDRFDEVTEIAKEEGGMNE